MDKNKLFLITTRGLGDYYIVAETSTEAEEILKKLLDKADYGFTSHRIIDNIRILTNEVITGFNDKPNFSNENRLIIKQNWKDDNN